MDKISFSCLKSGLEDYMTTVIYINGIDLKNKVEEVEIEQLGKRGLRVQDGCYEGIAFFIAFHNQDHFLCRTLKDYIYRDERYTLYDYKYSGVPGDHSLACKISIGAKKIIWHNFKNFSKIIPFELDYGDLEFHFCKEQYCEAIDRVRKNTKENRFA